MKTPQEPAKTFNLHRRLAAATAALMLLALAPGANGASHPFIQTNNYTGTELCLVCHQPENDLGDPAGELMSSVHWTWMHTNAPAGHAAQVMGKRNIINNYCITVDSNEPRCTSCHIGSGWRNDSFDFNNPNNLDCLVCHDTTGTYKKTPTGAGAPDPTVNLVTVAQNVGPTSRATCGACHFHGGGGDAVKHGDLDSTLTNPTRQMDVHMGVDGANMTCADCHQSVERGAGAHDLVGSRYSKPNPDNWLCEDCHTSAPHQGSPAAERLNLHTSRVACQSCHVPYFARGGKPTKMTWDWSTAGIKTNGATMQLKDAGGNIVYDTMKGTFTWASNVVPDYVWFNGDVIWTELNDTINPAQTVAINQLQGDASQARARIIPVKRFTAIQPYDAGSNTLAAPHLFALNANDTNAYWKGYNWTNALTTGMAAAGRTFSGQVGWVATEMYWVQNHMVAPKENAVSCAECHTASGGRLDFAALGYEPEHAAMLASSVLLAGADHTGRFGTNFAGSASCVQCHPNQIGEVMDSVHYLWRTTNSNLAYPGGGSHGMIDRFCGLVGSSAMVNYYASLAPYKDSGACGKCHVGDGLPFPNPQTGQFMQEQKDGIDCLICHASEGNYDMTGDGICDENDIDTGHRLLATNSATGRRAWFQDRSLRAAESVGGPVGVAQCYRCHEHGQAAADYKRGTPFEPEHDVHAAAGMKCTDCHLVDSHKMARGSRVTDMHAWERQDVEVTCVKCHSEQPHTNPAMTMLNQHTGLIACETCHIPWTSGAARRVWTSTFGVTGGPEAGVPIYDPTNNVFKPYSDYTPAYNQRPAYRWYNGQDSMLAEPIHDVNAWDGQVAAKNTPNAKIYAFRPIVNGMVMDGKGFSYNPNFNTNFTMLAAMDMMAGPLMQMGFMRPAGLTPQERAVLAQYPNLLNFDVETYIRTGDIRKAVNVGLGRVGVMMSGQDPWAMSDNMLDSIGANFWSGDVLGLDMPNNPMDPTFDGSDPTRPTGSFISLSHAIKRNGALACGDCHSPASVLDFAALGYTPERAAVLQSVINFNLGIEAGAAGVRLNWMGLPGFRYQLQSNTTLNDPDGWVNVPGAEFTPAITATLGWTNAAPPATGTLFYRVARTSP
jgi:octaheme c-type cytochrome (tetrathionate reductase family)